MGGGCADRRPGRGQRGDVRTEADRCRGGAYGGFGGCGHDSKQRTRHDRFRGGYGFPGRHHHHGQGRGRRFGHGRDRCRRGPGLVCGDAGGEQDLPVRPGGLEDRRRDAVGPVSAGDPRYVRQPDRRHDGRRQRYRPQQPCDPHSDPGRHLLRVRRGLERPGRDLHAEGDGCHQRNCGRPPGRNRHHRDGRGRGHGHGRNRVQRRP